jgi:hypothetical protein
MATPWPGTIASRKVVAKKAGIFKRSDLTVVTHHLQIPYTDGITLG